MGADATSGVPADSPDRPGVAALVSELEIQRHVRTALVTGIAFSLLVFVLFAYIPGTDESLLYWAALTFVLGFAVFGLVATVLVARAAYRRTLDVTGIDPGPRSPTTLAIVFGLLGWILLPVTATLAFDRLTPDLRLVVALLTGGFVVLVVGGLGLKLVAALSLRHEWQPVAAIVSAVLYTGLVAVPAVGCPADGFCLGTPDELAVAILSFDTTLVAPAYAVTALLGGAIVGFGVGLRGAGPAHGFFGGVVATASTLPVVAAATGDPEIVRTTALYLPVILGAAGTFGGAVALVVDDFGGKSDREKRSR